jgi:hypothetical protein
MVIEPVVAVGIAEEYEFTTLALPPDTVYVHSIPLTVSVAAHAPIAAIVATNIIISFFIIIVFLS